MIRFSLPALAVLAVAACAIPPDPYGPGAFDQTFAEAEPIEAFKPRPSGRSGSIDYDLIDTLLDEAVVNLGPSTRRLASDPRNPTPTRIKQGHQSKLRLEGNKVALSLFEASTRTAVRDYANSLIAIANSADITKLPRNEQLAYWFNLHNMLVIAELAEGYPVQKPSQMEIDGVPFHQAKLATIKGIPLSLFDIRERIVYAHWTDPKVMYGFFHGDLASPSILDQAWDARFLNRDLKRNAREFVNSLRGVDKRGEETLLVSPIYAEARGTLFRSWPDDLTQHLLTYANEEVSGLIKERPDIRFSRYEVRIADLAGGEPYVSISPNWEPISPVGGRPVRSQNLPLSVQRMQDDIGRKFASPEFKLRLRRGTVTIIDQEELEESQAEVQ
ncbi:MAG: DUF547 domain-containing protein [Pseudomonadota bacterium]